MASREGAAAFDVKWQIDAKGHQSWVKNGEVIECLWLSVAVDIEGTYDAYWGLAAEMREIRRADVRKEPGLAVCMSQADVDRYTRDNRRLVHSEAHSFPWQMGGHWACKAREHWLRLKTISSPDKRIATAIQAAAIEILNGDPSEPSSANDEPDRAHPKGDTAVPLQRRDVPVTGTKTMRMAQKIEQGDVPCECLCVLRVLASAPARFWSMPEIANGMQMQLSETGQPYRNDRYNESAAALDMTGLVRSSRAGRALMRQITELGLQTLQSR